MAVRNLVIVSALCLCGTAASAAPLTMQECRAKYKAVQAAGTLSGQTWVGFQVRECGHPPQPPRRPKSST
jgi:hypothetical protein